MSDPQTTLQADMAAALVDKIFSQITGFIQKPIKDLSKAIRVRYGEVFKSHLIDSYDRLKFAKSFIVRDEPCELYSIYVPTNLSQASLKFTRPKNKQIKKVGCIDLGKTKHHAVISGNGGSGKSFLMRHLFLDCIKTAHKIPVFVELRSINVSEMSLEELILASVNSVSGSITFDYIDYFAKEGKIMFLLDGFDELSFDSQEKITRQIKEMGIKYKKSTIVVTSRPSELLSNWNGFINYDIDRLDLDQAVELIQRVPFNLPIKTKFIERLNGGLFNQHKSFLSNPLLLSIMLLTFSDAADVPKRLSVFYQQAFETLFQRHDALKEGYKRNLRSNLDIADFSRVFSGFCLISYKTRVFTFFLEDIIKILEKVKLLTQIDFDPECIFHDLSQGTSLLVEDGNQISFTHRSFQEFFTAKYIAQADNDQRKKLIQSFINENTLMDQMPHLLYEISPNILEDNYILPKINNILKYTKSENAKESGKKLFLKIVHGVGLDEEKYPLSFEIKDTAEFHFLMFLNKIYKNIFPLRNNSKSPEKDERERISIKELLKDTERFEKVVSTSPFSSFTLEGLLKIKEEIMKNRATSKDVIEDLIRSK